MNNQLIYKTIYNSKINFFLRNINKALNPFFLKNIKLPPSGKIKIKVGDKNLIINANQSSAMAKYLFWNGPLNFEFTPMFLDLVKNADVFVDIGANIGHYSLLTALTNPKAKIYSFEPAGGPNFYLNKNVKSNNFTNIKVEKIALSKNIGTIDFYEGQNKKYTYLKYDLSGEGNAGSLTEVIHTFKHVVVPTITLDEYVANNSIEKIDLIKIDTEGTEHNILAGASKVLDEYRPLIICETNFDQIETELDLVMGNHNYEFYFYLPTGGLKKSKTIKRQTNDGACNCVFVPSEKTNLIKNFIIN